ncbi:MAG TPA: hypothetical protein VMG12_15560 [Polyangiaceae bacterium]|nr:hypothetical protein [Polyangiaceae bacterium]
MRGRSDSRPRVLGAAVASKQAEPASTVRVARSNERTLPAVASARPTIDIILQGSTVELFHAHGVAVAPLGSSPVGEQQRYYDSVGMVGFDATAFSGTLTLSIPTPVFETYCESHDPAERTTLADWTQELTNQLLGRIKNRLTMFQTNLRSHLPSAMSGIALDRLRKRSPDEVLYRFRALRGDIIVTLDAPLGGVTLTYSGVTQVHQEGEVILF